jgi:hypothetical protein
MILQNFQYSHILFQLHVFHKILPTAHTCSITQQQRFLPIIMLNQPQQCEASTVHDYAELQYLIGEGDAYDYGINASELSNDDTCSISEIGSPQPQQPDYVPVHSVKDLNACIQILLANSNPNPLLVPAAFERPDVYQCPKQNVWSSDNIDTANQQHKKQTNGDDCEDGNDDGEEEKRVTHITTVFNSISNSFVPTAASSDRIPVPYIPFTAPCVFVRVSQNLTMPIVISNHYRNSMTLFRQGGMNEHCGITESMEEKRRMSIISHSHTMNKMYVLELATRIGQCLRDPSACGEYTNSVMRRAIFDMDVPLHWLSPSFVRSQQQEYCPSPTPMFTVPQLVEGYVPPLHLVRPCDGTDDIDYLFPPSSYNNNDNGECYMDGVVVVEDNDVNNPPPLLNVPLFPDDPTTTKKKSRNIDFDRLDGERLHQAAIELSRESVLGRTHLVTIMPIALMSSTRVPIKQVCTQIGMRTPGLHVFISNLLQPSDFIYDLAYASVLDLQALGLTVELLLAISNKLTTAANRNICQTTYLTSFVVHHNAQGHATFWFPYDDLVINISDDVDDYNNEYYGEVRSTTEHDAEALAIVKQLFSARETNGARTEMYEGMCIRSKQKEQKDLYKDLDNWQKGFQRSIKRNAERWMNYIFDPVRVSAHASNSVSSLSASMTGIVPMILSCASRHKNRSLRSFKIRRGNKRRTQPLAETEVTKPILPPEHMKRVLSRAYAFRLIPVDVLQFQQTQLQHLARLNPGNHTFHALNAFSAYPVVKLNEADAFRVRHFNIGLASKTYALLLRPSCCCGELPIFKVCNLQREHVRLLSFVAM